MKSWKSKGAFGGRLLLVGLMAGLVLAGPLEAQRGTGRRGGGMQDRDALEQRVRAMMGRMMQQRLGLTEDQSAQLSEVVGAFDERRAELALAELAARRRVEALVLEGGEDDTEARELLARMAGLRQQEAAIFAEEQDALLEILSPVQVLQMHGMREQIGERIRALRGDRGETRGGRRRGGGSRER